MDHVFRRARLWLVALVEAQKQSEKGTMSATLDHELPPEFLEGLDTRSKWMYSTLNNHGHVLTSICDTQTRILDRMEKGDKQFVHLEKTVRELQEARLVLKSTWAVVALVVGGFLWPVILIVSSHWLSL